MIRFVFILIATFLPMAALAESCPGNPQALGTERVMEVNAKVTPRVGRKHFPSTLPLNAKELVLTFDDGPWPGTTSKVLDALKAECVRATFFLLGRNAAARPQLARRALAEGHTLGHHSDSHPLLSRMRLAEAGIVELQKVVDTLLIIPNQNLFRVAVENTTFADAFALADQVLYSGVACITDLIVKEGLINLDFADVRTVMNASPKMFAGIIVRFGVARSSNEYLLKKIVLRCGNGGKLSGATTPAHRISQPIFFGRVQMLPTPTTVTACRMTQVELRRTFPQRGKML